MTTEQDVSWDEIELLVEKLSRKISKLSQKFSSITTLSRGGLVSSCLLADHLGIENFFVNKKKISSNSIFVDDIFDSGKTFNNIISNVDNTSELIFVTLFARRGKKYPKQFVYTKKTDNTAYVVFPWDKLEFKRSQK